MEYLNDTLCISHAELTDGIMTESNLKYHISAGNIVRVRRACFGKPALYDVASMLSKYRAEVKRRYTDPEAQAKARAFIDTIVIDNAAAAFYDAVEIEGARGLSAEKRLLYTNGASILNACRAMLEAAVNEQRKVGRSHRVKMSDFWCAVAKHLPRVAEYYPHSLPENPRVLQRKFNEYFKGGEPHYEVLISGRFRNKNAARVATAEQVAIITKFLSHHTNLDCAEVAEYYNTVASAYGWESVTARTIWNWSQKLGWAVNPGRYGAKNYLNEMGMQVKRHAPSAPLLYWTLDGWVAELYYKKAGKRGTTYCNRLTVVVVLDTYNKYPIGYAVGEHESAGLIKEALRNAVNHTWELFGQRYRATQLQSDNYAIKKMLPVYGTVAKYVTPAQVGNAKSKVIEPYFKYLNRTYAKKCSGNWSGYGITSRKENQPNLDWLNAHKGQIPTEGEVRAQIEGIIAAERAAKREEYVGGRGKTPAERLLPMSRENYLLTFGEETGYKNALEGSGLNVRLLGERHAYDCFDVEFRKYAHLRWSVKYDPEDLSQVLAVSEEGDLRFMLEEKYVQPMALADRQEGDVEQLERVREFNRELKRTVIEHDLEATEMARATLLSHPDLNNPYAKSLITDGRGQHKDRRSQYRLEYTEEAEEVQYEESSGAGDATTTRDLY